MLNTSPSEPEAISSEPRMWFTIRMLKYFFCWLMLWQGNMVSGSLLQLWEVFPPLPYISFPELLAIVLGILTLVERTLSGDFRIKRSYFAGPLLLIAIAFFVSWCRGSVITQRFTAVLEGHEAFALPIAFFVISNAFREERDFPVLAQLLLFAVIAKSLDGLSVYFFSHDVAKGWGVIQLWRDSYLMGVGIATSLVLVHYRGSSLRWLKRLMIGVLPLTVGVLVLSFRRAAMVGLVCALGFMFFTLPRERRRRHVYTLLAFVLLFLAAVLASDPVGILLRLSGIVDPSGEGSAYIRVMEFPNVLQNIWHNPIFGTAVGVPWKVYYRMPVSADYTTLGTHNSYLYWPLRAGIFGAIGFWGFFTRAWKSALISYRLRRSEEEFFYGQFLLQMIVLYTACSAFGLLYGDYMSSMMGAVLTMIQLQTKRVTGRYSLREVAFLPTMRSGKLIFRTRAPRRASAHAHEPLLPNAVATV